MQLNFTTHVLIYYTYFTYTKQKNKKKNTFTQRHTPNRSKQQTLEKENNVLYFTASPKSEQIRFIFQFVYCFVENNSEQNESKKQQQQQIVKEIPIV